MWLQFIQSYVAWAVLPHIGAKALRGAYYAVVSRYASKLVPPVDSPQHRRDLRNCRVAVVVMYLLYTVWMSYQNILDDPVHGPDFYTQLGVDPVTVTKQQLRSVYRSLSLTHHPDKVGSGGAQMWVEIKRMYMVLSNSGLRFAYDRLGWNVVDLYSKQTGVEHEQVAPSEILAQGAKDIASFYGSHIASIVFWSWVPSFRPVAVYWRCWMLFAGLVLELYIVSRPNSFVAGLLPFQQVAMFRQVLTVIQTGTNQLVWLVVPPPSAAAEPKYNLAKEMEKLQHVMVRAEAVAHSLQKRAMSPFERSENEHMYSRAISTCIDRGVQKQVAEQEAVQNELKQLGKDIQLT